MARTPHRTRYLAPLLAAALLLMGGRLAAQDDDGRTLRISELAVEARLDARGRLHIRERQGMVFDGAWNGGEVSFDLRTGQAFDFQSIARVDPATGERIPLTEGDLDDVDEYSWEGGTLRWRSRLESDPPFANEEITYELEYALAPVLARDGDDYRLQHDFAFSNRPDVDRFRVDLALDSAWSSPFGRNIREEASPLPAGRGYTLTVPLEYAGAEEPLAAPRPPPAAVRGPIALGALLVPLLVLLGLRRRDRELDQMAPETPPDEIDASWLETHIFAYPPEVVGTAWDRDVGQAEVAALLARLVAEGKLGSRVDPDDKEPVLHLTRNVPLSDFEEHERELLEGLFFDGGDQTDTASVREHYEKKGFDPAARIRDALLGQLSHLPGDGRVRRPWLPGLLVAAAGVAAAVLVPDGPGRAAVVAVAVALLAATALIALALAATLSKRVAGRRGFAIAVVVVLAVPALVLALVAWGTIPGAQATVFYRPGAALLLSLVVALAGIGWCALALARPGETAERLAFRRRLVSARRFFTAELERPAPRLQDAWFPYLLAFGLGTHVDRWFRAFGGRHEPDPSRVALGGMLGASGAAGRGGSGGSGWTGGGPQFGGGQFGGGGAGGAWGVAAAGMAAGVAAPSSTGGGGGGVSISGGGARGGW